MKMALKIVDFSNNKILTIIIITTIDSPFTIRKESTKIVIKRGVYAG